MRFTRAAWRWGGRAHMVVSAHRGASTWITDYLSDGCVYHEGLFRRRLRVPRMRFHRGHDDLGSLPSQYWGQKKLVGGRKRIPSEIKVLVCLRLLRIRDSYDNMDDGARMAEETVRLYFQQSYKDIMKLNGNRYLNRRRTKTELANIVQKYEKAGFPGCGGCIDFMKVVWKNCSFVKKGQYQNSRDGGLVTILAERGCDRRLYVWSWFCNRAGTNNDHSVLRFSPIFKDIISGRFPFTSEESYCVVQREVTPSNMYLLADGIYPSWPFFVKPLHQAAEEEELRYTRRQESNRKDIERCFGILKTRFEIIRQEKRRWDVREVERISHVCVILHNMHVNMVEKGTVVTDIGSNIIEELLIEEEEIEGSCIKSDDAEYDSQREVSTSLGAETTALPGNFRITEKKAFMLQEHQMTSKLAFLLLQTELIERFNS